MTNVDFKNFKKYVEIELTKKYNLTPFEARKMINKSYLNQAYKKDKGYIEHDSVEYWVDFIYKEDN